MNINKWYRMNEDPLKCTLRLCQPTEYYGIGPKVELSEKQNKPHDILQEYYVRCPDCHRTVTKWIDVRELEKTA